MLITCPECGLQVSDRAVTCPHCGYPLKEPQKYKRKTHRRRRLPNGFGSITEVKGRNLRNPFYTRVCVGKTEEGRPILKALQPQSYFATYNEAYSALVKYHQNPYELLPDTTMLELHGRWFEEYSKKNSISAQKTMITCWGYCSAIAGMKVRDVRIHHLRSAISDGMMDYQGIERKAGTHIQKKIKTMFNLMFDYAVAYELTDVNVARQFKISTPDAEVQKPHKAFTKDELRVLWHSLDAPYADMVTIQCYTGLRPQELCRLKNENINLEERSLVGGMKTDAGIDRLIPIHNAILPLVSARYDENSEYLFGKISYRKYKYEFDILMAKLGMEHTPHDARKTFITMAKNSNINDFAIKRIVGHSIKQDITESIYTERPLEWLLTEVNKIQVSK